jgi:hypothetical protein
MKKPDPNDYTGQFGDIELVSDEAKYVVYLEEEVRRYQILNACSMELMSENQAVIDDNKARIKDLERSNRQLSARSLDYLTIYKLMLKHHPAEELVNYHERIHQLETESSAWEASANDNYKQKQDALRRIKVLEKAAL